MSAAFTPGPWCWEQCGEKEDAPVVGIAYLNSDTDCKNPLSGYLRDCDENGNELQYYRETIAFEIQSCDGCSASANAALIAAAPELYSICQRAANTFRAYEALHRAKLTPEGEEKANSNSAMAAELEVALAKARGQ